MQSSRKEPPGAAGGLARTRRQVIAALAVPVLATGTVISPLAARKRRKKKPKAKTRRVTRTYVNGGQIRIPGNAGELGRADPYPSSLVVADLKGGTVRHVSVTVKGLTHGTGDEVLLMLAKDTTNAVLMVRTGGKAPVNNATITFDDLAATTLPLATALVSGQFQPTLNDALTSLPFHFPTPAPELNGNSLLSAFQGADPNGSWRLYAADRAIGGDGAISGGWELTITADVPKARKKRRKQR